MIRVPMMNYSNQNPVGMIVQSMLTETQFQLENGPSWVLADGRNVAGSQYATVTGSSTIPDLRGMVLRGKNNSRADGNQDPGGERALGNYQADAFQGHEHQSWINNTNSAGGGGGWHYDTTNSQKLNTTGRVSDGSNGTPRTASETRVKNVTVNFFIKINQ